MAKYSGRVGFTKTEKSKPGVMEPVTTYRSYRGDVERKSYRMESPTTQLNTELNISNVISIMGDEHAFKNFQYISCVEYMGALWHVTNVEVAHPRLKLTIGGVFNGPKN
jgi:hypothetical protein